MKVGDLFAILHLDTKPFKAALTKAEAEGKASAGRMSGAMALAAKAAVAGLTVGVLAVAASFTAGAMMASDFNAEMEKVHTQAGATKEEVENLKGSVLGLAGKVGQTPEQLAKGLFHIESAGLRGADAMNLLETAAKGAAVGGDDLESVANALIATVTSGIKGVDGMSESMGVLNAIIGAGNMRMEDLTGAMTTGILSTAKTFGVSIQSVGAALADMTRQGMPAQQSATRLRMTLSLLGAPTAKAAEQLSQIGIGSMDLANAMRGPDGLFGALTMLKEHLDESGMSATEQAALISRAFGGGRSSGAIMALLGDLENFGKVQKQVMEGTHNFGEAWASVSEENEFKMEAFGAAASAIFIRIGNIILPMVTDAFAAMSDFLDDNGDAIVGVFGAIGEAVKVAFSVVGTVIGVAVTVISKFIDVLNFLKPALIAIGIAITAALIPALVSMALAAGAAAIAMVVAFAPVVLAIAAVVAAAAAASAAVNYFAMDFGDMGDKLHEIADRTEVDFNQVKEVTRALMDEYGLSFEEATERAEAALDEQGAAYDEAAVHAEAALARQNGAMEGAGDSAEAGKEQITQAMRDMESAVGTSTDEAASDVESFASRSLKAIQDLERGAAEAGDAAADAWLDPIETKLKIAATKAELGSKELRDKLKSKDPDIRRDAELRVAQLIADMVKLKNAQAEQGDKQAQIAKTKSLLTSQFMRDGLRSKDAEIRKTFQVWKEELEKRLAEMRSAAATGGAAVGYNFGVSLGSQRDFIAQQGAWALGGFTEQLPGSEPRDPNSPLRGITRGFDFGPILARGFQESLSSIRLGAILAPQLDYARAAAVSGPAAGMSTTRNERHAHIHLSGKATVDTAKDAARMWERMAYLDG